MRWVGFFLQLAQLVKQARVARGGEVLQGGLVFFIARRHEFGWLALWKYCSPANPFPEGRFDLLPRLQGWAAWKGTSGGLGILQTEGSSLAEQTQESDREDCLRCVGKVKVVKMKNFDHLGHLPDQRGLAGGGHCADESGIHRGSSMSQRRLFCVTTAS